MKYILHFKDGNDEVAELEWLSPEECFDSNPLIESWETWYPEWQGDEREGNEKTDNPHG
jgi:hypothetical protein